MVSYNFDVLNGFLQQGHSRRPPIIEDPMEKILCCAILEDPGSSKLGGGGLVDVSKQYIDVTKTSKKTSNS